MREHMGLFRGKRIDNGEWVEGAFVPEVNWGGKHWGVSISYFTREGWLDDVEVDPNTIGECTSLKDKSGKLIWEGDIIKHYNRDDNPDAFDVGKIFWDTKKCRWLRTSQECDCIPEVWSSSAKKYVVIGNAHDNPELLKGGEG